MLQLQLVSPRDVQQQLLNLDRGNNNAAGALATAAAVLGVDDAAAAVCCQGNFMLQLQQLLSLSD